MVRDGDSSPRIKKIVTTTRFEEEESEPHAAPAHGIPIKWNKIKSWSDRIGSLWGFVLIILAIAGAGYMVSGTMEQKVDRQTFQTAMENITEKLSKQDDKIDTIDDRMRTLELKVVGELALIRYWVEEVGKKNDVKPPPATLASPTP